VIHIIEPPSKNHNKDAEKLIYNYVSRKFGIGYFANFYEIFFFLPLLYGDIESNKMKQHEFAWFLGLFMYI